MRNYRINANYARALFMLATERGVAERVADDMRLVGNTAAANRTLAVVFANPTLPIDRKKAVLDDLFGSHVCNETMAFLHFVLHKNRAMNMRGMANAYLDLYRESRNTVLAELVTHAEADEVAKQRAISMVADHTGKDVELHTTTDPGMLGGFKLEFDNMMYDARLRTKIRKLRREFAKNDYEKKL